ncbi:hypothetical protein PInf_004814 [Phytophthora infestans]|nr:hypothetical protein PInf_004814 [Phytophthora infestans]
MDMKVADIHARIVKYSMSFNQPVDEHGRMAWVGRGPVTDAAGRQQRLVAVTHQHAKLDDVALYELIVGRAKYQQYFHTMQSELKRDDPPRGKTAGSTKSGAGKQQHVKTAGKPERSKPEQKTTSAPPWSGCLVGSLHLTNVSCLVMDGHEDEFLFGRKAMQHIDINIYRLFEQLAGGRVGDADDDDASRDNPQLVFAIITDEINIYLDRMLVAAAAAGFGPALLSDLRNLVYEYPDVWRVLRVRRLKLNAKKGILR